MKHLEFITLPADHHEKTKLEVKTSIYFKNPKIEAVSILLMLYLARHLFTIQKKHYDSLSNNSEKKKDA